MNDAIVFLFQMKLACDILGLAPFVFVWYVYDLHIGWTQPRS